MIQSLCFLLIGLFFLWLGAHLLVKGGTALALLLKLTPAVIGLTIIAIGTSLPELFVGLTASAARLNNLLVGNLMGSNIINIALVIGLSALIIPIPASRQSLKTEWPVMFILTLIAGFTLINLSLSRPEGLLLIAGTAASTGYFVYLGRKTHSKTLEGETQEVLSMKKNIDAGNKWVLGLKYVSFVIGGFFILRYGSDFFVNGASQLARILGISERVIGITVVALGTSLPELAVSIFATLKGRCDLAIGNILGSNIFNLAGVLGICATLRPFSFSEKLLMYDFPWLLAISVLFLLTMMGKHGINRWRGGLLLLAYGIYTISLFR